MECKYNWAFTGRNQLRHLDIRHIAALQYSSEKVIWRGISWGVNGHTVKGKKSQRKARDLFHRVKMDLFIWSFVHKNKDLLWPEYISAAFESTRLLAKDCVIGRQILWRTDVCALPHLCIWKRFYVISVHSPTENKVAGNYHKSVQRKLIIHFLRTLKSNGIPILYFSCTLVNLDWNLYQIASCTRHFHWGKKGGRHLHII